MSKTRLNPLAELFVTGTGTGRAKPDNQQLRRAASNYLGDLVVPGLAALPQPDRLSADLRRQYKGKGGRQDVLAHLKAILAAGHTEIREQFEQARTGEPIGAMCVRQHAKLADGVIQAIFRLAFDEAYPLVNPTDNERLALVATGGYGRAELSPQSDIDLLFILPYKRTPTLEQGIEFILYLLWDLGLKVGQAVRGIDDCIRQAKADMTIRTNLLECRFLAGDISLFGEFQSRFDKDIVAGSSQDFITAKLRERDDRYKQMGETRYMLEPNVKSGLGGLRDLHVLFWIAKYVHEVDQVHDLVGLGELSEAEAETFDRAQNFLWAVRAHLHYLTGRGEDRLTFDLQPEISRRLGYVDHGTTLGVERFMKHYFLVVREVGALSRIITTLYQEQAQGNAMTRLGQAIWGQSVDGFSIKGGWLQLPSPNHFKQAPTDIMRVFRVAQEQKVELHPQVLQTITRDLRLIGKKFRDDPGANAQFLEILMDHQAGASLRLMNDTDVLGRFMRDWARIVAQMQYDMYHVYTVDEHTIHAVSILHKITSGELIDQYPLASQVAEQISSKRALFVAMLLHDIAKGRNGDHSILGEKVALKLCPRLGLTDEETETVAWLIRWHLAMSETALKRDLDDLKALDDFVGLVQSIERLRLLLVLTTADISAVGPDRWNSWKAGLIGRLFFLTAQKLRPGDVVGLGIGADNERVDAFRKMLSDWSEDRIDRFIELAPGGIWHAFDVPQLARLARLFSRAETGQEEIAVDTQIEKAAGYTQVAVITKDRKGLFAALAGAIAATGGTILDAKIFTFSNGWVLDVFAIQDFHGNPITGGDKLARLSVNIHRMLDEPDRVVKQITRRWDDLPKRMDVFTVPPRVMVDNSASNQSTVVEVNGRDRPGLLYDLGRVLTEDGLQITAAKVTTYGEKAIDIFYLRDAGGLKITHQGRLEQIRERLLSAIDGDDDQPSSGQAGSYSASKRRQERGSLEPMG
ncbi:MAG: [protein-PII] uridylyltransferase [Pseudomonadota bacterium]